MGDWEEIKRLAADFQRAQLSSTAQRLSERNCIEIVQKLQSLCLIEVIYTTDGKEYLTPQELTKEIREELLVRGGRVNLVDLQHILNINFNHVEAKAQEIAKQDRNITLILGQLIDESYLDGICEEVNDKLQEHGQITIAELTKVYDLPGEFLSQAVGSRLGTIVKGQRDDFDRNVIFTQSFVERQRAKVRGAFSAVTRPINIMNIMHQYHLQERLFHSIVETLVNSGRLAGSISGSSQYVPDMYTKSQNEYVDAFYRQNGYLEYESLTRLGIGDVKGFIKKRLKGENVLYLRSCCMGSQLMDQVEATVDEALANNTWVDVQGVLPSILSTEDTIQIVQKILKGKRGAVTFCDSIVTSDNFVNNCSKPFDKLMHSKAEKDIKNNPALLASTGDKGVSTRSLGMDDGSGAREDKKDQRRKKGAAAGKAGGGTQGREGKTKSTKNKYMKGKGDRGDSDDEAPSKSNQPVELKFMSVGEITEELRNHKALCECPDEFIEEIATQLYRPLSKQYQQVAQSIFIENIGTGSSSSRKKVHGELADKISGLWTNAVLFEKGLSLLDDDTQTQLCKHLLKTVCADIVNLIVNTLAADHMLSVPDETSITPEMRLKILSQFPEDKRKTILTKLHMSLNGKSLDDFFTQVETVCGPGQLEIILKKPDKKKERQLVFNHRHALASQLRDEPDPAMALHLGVTIMFQVFTQCIVHAPGRCVPQLIIYLKSQGLPAEAHALMVQCQELIVRQIKTEGDEKEEISNQLQELLPKVKDAALTTKKSATQASED